MTAPHIPLSLEREFCLLLQGRKRLTVGALRTVTDLKRNIGDQAGEPGSKATEGEFCPGTLDRSSLRKSVSSGLPGVRNQLPMFCRPCSPELTLGRPWICSCPSIGRVTKSRKLVQPVSFSRKANQVFHVPLLLQEAMKRKTEII